MKKALVLILAAAFFLGACASTQQENSASQKDVGAPNPFHSFKRLDEAEKKAGFKFNLLDVFESYTIQAYRVIPKKLFEAVYDSESGDEIRIRKAPGKDDPSGDYNVYAEKSSQKIKGIEATFFATGNKCGKVVWHSDGYSYSLTSQDKVSIDRALKTVTKVIEMNQAQVVTDARNER